MSASILRVLTSDEVAMLRMQSGNMDAPSYAVCASYRPKDPQHHSLGQRVPCSGCPSVGFLAHLSASDFSLISASNFKFTCSIPVRLLQVNVREFFFAGAVDGPLKVRGVMMALTYAQYHRCVALAVTNMLLSRKCSDLYSLENRHWRPVRAMFTVLAGDS